MRFGWAVCLALFAVGCATPEAIQEKSRAQLELYRKADGAFTELRTQIVQELKAADRATDLREVRTGDAKPAFLGGAPSDAAQVRAKETANVDRALAIQSGVLSALRIQYGAIDRFLQIDVVDPGDLRDVTQRVSEASNALGSAEATE